MKCGTSHHAQMYLVLVLQFHVCSDRVQTLFHNSYDFSLYVGTERENMRVEIGAAERHVSPAVTFTKFLNYQQI